MGLIEKSTAYCIRKHTGQTRKLSNIAYAFHPSTVAWLVHVFKKSKNHDVLISAALLHDVVEDCDTSIEEIEKEFGPFVAELVAELTNDKTITDWDEKHAYMIGKLVTMSSYALTIKLCDFVANLSDCGENDQFSKSFRKKISLYVKTLRKFRKFTPTQLRLLSVIDELLDVAK